MSANIPKKIILFITDHQRYDTFSALGHSVIKTPNFDKLMEEGVTFTKAYSHCPLCVPSRTNLWTGLPAHVTNIYNNKRGIPLGTLCLPEFLSDLDWYTINIGRLHFRPWRNPHGFQRNFLSDSSHPFTCDFLYSKLKDKENITADTPFNDKSVTAKSDEYLKPNYTIQKDGEDVTSWVTNKAIMELKRSGSLPTFMNIGYIKPHPQFCAPEKFSMMYNPETIPLPADRFEPEENLPKAIKKLKNRKQKTLTISDYLTDDILSKNTALFYGDITHIDYNLGKLIKSLKDNGFWEDTLLICTSDHGEMLGNHGMYLKNNFYEQAAHVPLILSWPNGIPLGIKIDEVVSLQDIFNTILEIIDHPYVSRYKKYRHANLIEMANGHIQENNKVFIQVTGKCDWGICNVNKRYKYSFYTYSDNSWEHTLYDLNNDPNELCNIANENPLLVNRFRKEIANYIKKDITINNPIYKNYKLLESLI